MRQFFSYLLFFTCSFIVMKVSADEAPISHELYCSDKGENGPTNFLQMSQDLDKTYQFSTETTSKYLMGLSCEFPTDSALLFRCKGDQSSQVYFFSQHVVEEGYDSAYGRYVKMDFLKFTITYNYMSNSGENKQAVRTRTYLLANCSIK